MHASLKVVRGAVTLIVLVLLVSPAIAQTITGSVRGTVTDPSEAMVTHAKVSAINMATGVTTNTTTGQNGSYSIQFLPIGPYAITATASDFSISSVGPFTLQIDQIAKIDAKIQVGAADASVNVPAETLPILQTQDATIGTTISSDTLASLSLSGLIFSVASMFVPDAVNPTFNLMGGSNGTERDTSASAVPTTELALTALNCPAPSVHHTSTRSTHQATASSIYLSSKRSPFTRAGSAVPLRCLQCLQHSQLCGS